jgi:chaperonin cofactor prefoldin
MGLDEVRRRIDKLQEGTSGWPSQVATTDGYVYDLQTVYRAICDVTKALDELEEVDDPPVNVDDGFAILPMARYEALREAEENLQETRFEPADGEADEKQATIDALTRRLDGLAESNRRLVEGLDGRGRYIHEQAAEIGLLKEAAKVRAEATAPGPTAPEPQLHPVLDKHLQDIQAEIDAIKGRLDEGCGQSNKIEVRLGEVEHLVGSTNVATPNLRDRINAFAARMNRLEADVMPFRRIGPGTGPRDRQRDEATRDRLLQEIKRVAGGVEPKPS